MKLSVSLPADDVATLDEYAHASGLPSRSAVLQHADLEQDYATAWDEWQSSGDQVLWEAAAADGLADAAR